jgi:hypothetical protein
MKQCQVEVWLRQQHRRYEIKARISGSHRRKAKLYNNIRLKSDEAEATKQKTIYLILNPNKKIRCPSIIKSREIRGF